MGFRTELYEYGMEAEARVVIPFAPSRPHLIPSLHIIFNIPHQRQLIDSYLMVVDRELNSSPSESETKSVVLRGTIYNSLGTDYLLLI